MAKRTKKLLSNGLDLTVPKFLNRKNAKTAALVDKGRATFNDERRATQERRAAEATKARLIKATKDERKKVKDITPKATAAKSKPAKPVRATKSAISPDAVLTVLVDSFPHRAGSQAEAKSALLKTGMTVADYQAAGAGLGLKGNWHLAHIKYCVNYNLIKVEG